jgi:hypothetical protein
MFILSFAILSVIALHVQHAANIIILQIPLTVEIITAMVSQAIFDLGGMEDIVVSSKIAKTSILLHLCADGESPEQYPTSGFPRSLMLEQQHKGITPHILNKNTLRKPETNPTPPARLSPRLNAGSLKRYPPVPSLDGVNAGGSSHSRSVSQPDLSIRNLVAGEKEAWKSDGSNTTDSEPTTPAPESDHLGPSLSKFLSAKRSISNMITTFHKSPSESSLVPASPRTSTDENREPTAVDKEKPSAVDKELEHTDDEFESEIERAKQESLREVQAAHQHRLNQHEYVANPSYPWHNTIPGGPEAMHSHFEPYPTFPSSVTAPQQPHLLARTDSTDEELQKALEISRRDQGPMHIITPIPTIQVDERPLQTPQDELQKVLELSRIEYEMQQTSNSRWH